MSFAHLSNDKSGPKLSNKSCGRQHIDGKFFHINMDSGEICHFCFPSSWENAHFSLIFYLGPFLPFIFLKLSIFLNWHTALEVMFPFHSTQKNILEINYDNWIPLIQVMQCEQNSDSLRTLSLYMDDSLPWVLLSSIAPYSGFVKKASRKDARRKKY